MLEQPFCGIKSRVHSLDPRARIVVALAFALVTAGSMKIGVLLIALAAAIAVVALAKLPAWPLAKRILSVNIFILLIWILVPVSTPGATVWRGFGLIATREGVQLAEIITLKCNAILLACTGLIATMTLVDFGHALTHLRVPPKLIHLFLFTVRYFELLHQEYLRLRNAMRIRCFHLGTNMHSYRSIGYLVGMLLVRSLERSERVYAAMKCRGFKGQFYMLRHFTICTTDKIFVAGSFSFIVIIGLLQWLPIKL